MSDVTLTDGVVMLMLDEDLFWEDEFSWSPVEQSITRSVTGAQIIQLGERRYGRPITLRNYDADSGWLTRADMSRLNAWAAVPGQRLLLNIRGTQYRVLFRHHDGGPFDAAPRVFYSDPLPGDFVLATVRLITVSPE